MLRPLNLSAYRRTVVFLVGCMLLGWSVVRAGGFTASIGQPSWSPDGSRLVYAVRDQGVFIVGTDGENRPQRITEAHTFDLSPVWSPDGLSIVSTIEVNNRSSIYRTPIADGEALALTQDDGWRPDYYAPGGIYPAYSPDGQSIAFLSLRQDDDYMSLYVMTAQGKDERRLTTLGTVTDFAWSPDSQTIAFSAIPGGYNDPEYLYTIDADGNDLQQLTHTDDLYNGGAPFWMLGGDQIVFTTGQPSHRNLEIINADGTNRRVLRENAFDVEYSPDGKQVVYSMFSVAPDARWPEMHLMNADGSNDQMIDLGGDRAYYNASWSPDGAHIAFVTFHFEDPKSEDIVIVNADGGDPRVVVSRSVE
jgi:Tol biopolymer transport system component